MPPRRYLLVHPDAALSEAERQVLVDALEAWTANGVESAVGRRSIDSDRQIRRSGQPRGR
jgi:hypothetical protein